MKRMRELSNSKGRGDTEVVRPEDEPVVDADLDDGEAKLSAFGMWKDRDELADVDAWVRNLRRGRFDAF
ncbi:MAG: hypothetical protein OXE57_16520 [Alphaproteobacteria bacterium]|nr:hypothetical protein [Alphaproteobacteria bacterium]